MVIDLRGERWRVDGLRSVRWRVDGLEVGDGSSVVSEVGSWVLVASFLMTTMHNEEKMWIV